MTGAAGAAAVAGFVATRGTHPSSTTTGGTGADILIGVLIGGVLPVALGLGIGWLVMREPKK